MIDLWSQRWHAPPTPLPARILRIVSIYNGEGVYSEYIVATDSAKKTREISFLLSRPVSEYDHSCSKSKPSPCLYASKLTRRIIYLLACNENLNPIPPISSNFKFDQFWIVRNYGSPRYFYETRFFSSKSRKRRRGGGGKSWVKSNKSAK